MDKKQIESAAIAAYVAKGAACSGCNGRGEVGGLRPDGYDTEQCPFCKGSGSEAPLSEVKAEPSEDRVIESARRLVEHADFNLGGILSADSKARDIPSRAVSTVKARHLAALRDALAARQTSPQQGAAQSDGCTERNCERCNAHPAHREGLHHAGISAAASAPTVGGAWRPSDAQFQEWQARHDLIDVERAAFDDAASLYLAATPSSPAVEEALPMTLDSAAEDVRRTGYSATLHGVEFSVEEASSAGAVDDRTERLINDMHACVRQGLFNEKDAAYIMGAIRRAAVAPAVPADGEQPIAWLMRFDGAPAVVCTAQPADKVRANGLIAIDPLYTRPSAAGADEVKDAQDAARYRWLREQVWNEAPMCVIMRPKANARLGADCPSLGRLDDAIDAARAGGEMS